MATMTTPALGTAPAIVGARQRAALAQITAQVERQARHLRERAAEIEANIDSMHESACEIGERCGWSDPRLHQIVLDIQAAEVHKAHLLGQADGLVIAARWIAA